MIETEKKVVYKAFGFSVTSEISLPELPIIESNEESIDIEVKIEEMSGAQYNSETGEIKWTLTLAPGETVKKRLAFKVKYPKDKLIIGL